MNTLGTCEESHPERRPQGKPCTSSEEVEQAALVLLQDAGGYVVFEVLGLYRLFYHELVTENETI